MTTQPFYTKCTSAALLLLLLLSLCLLAPTAHAANQTINGVTFDSDGLVTNSMHYVLVQAVPATAEAVDDATLDAISAALESTVADELSRGGLEFLVNVTAIQTMPSSYPAAAYIARTTATADSLSSAELMKMKGSFSMGNGRGGTLFTLQVVQLQQGYIVGGASAKALVSTQYTYTSAEVNSLVGQADISAAVTTAGSSGNYTVAASRLDEKEGFACYSACKGMIAMAAVIGALMLVTVLIFSIILCCCWRNQVKDSSNERIRKASTVEPIAEDQEFYYDKEGKKQGKAEEGLIAREDTAMTSNQ